MASMPNAPEVFYAIRQTGDRLYEVAKFVDGEPEPRDVYDVELSRRSEGGTCNCPAARWRRTGGKDKHVKLVRDWIAMGCPVPALIKLKD
jgi:hypothetical protein